MDLDEVDDAELRSVISRASSLVNTFCAAPNLPQRHDFRGGSITGEQHAWRLGTDHYTGTRRVYVWHKPVKSVTSLAIRVTNTMSVSLSASDLFINNSEGYVEVTSLAAVSFGIYPIGVVPNLGLYVPVAEITYDYGWAFTETDEQLDSYDAASYMSSHMSWAADPAPVIKKNGTVLTTDKYTVNYVEGTVTVVDAPTATDRYTATYTYTLPDAIQEATGVIATAQLGERALASKGLTGLASLRVAEVAFARTMSREGQQNSSLNQAFVVPEAAQALLSPYRFHSVG
jgi:hypothetical protein